MAVVYKYKVKKSTTSKFFLYDWHNTASTDIIQVQFPLFTKDSQFYTLLENSLGLCVNLKKQRS